jgi:hypothetical protein
VVALMAPGGSLPLGILSTSRRDDRFTYVYQTGTSQAAAYVSATVALMTAVNPALRPEETRRALEVSADPTGRCPLGCGAGLLDVDTALTLAADPAALGPVAAHQRAQGCSAAGPGAGVDAIAIVLFAFGITVGRRRRRV